MDKINNLNKTIKNLNKKGEVRLISNNSDEYGSDTSVKELEVFSPLDMEMLKGNIIGIKDKVGKNHIIHTFISEHEMIFSLLENLESINLKIQGAKNYDQIKKEFKELKEVSSQLIDKDSHQVREEEVLFSELERRNIYIDSKAMRVEHVWLNKAKRDLGSLASVGTIEFNIFKKELNSIVNFIISDLKSHMFKENNILFPAALEAITDNETWIRLKEECDSIGYHLS